MSAYLRLIVMGSKASSIMDWNSYHQRISLPSENFTSVFVVQTVGSVMTNKYSEGYPDPRYYGGNGYINMAESLYQKHAFEAFRLDPVKWGGKSQPNSPTIRPEEREKTFAAQLKMKRKYCSPSDTSPKRGNGSPTKQKEKESKGSAQPEQLVPKANEKEIRFFGRWLQAFLGCLEGKFQERKEGGCHLISERANQGAVNDLYLFLFHAIKD